MTSILLTSIIMMTSMSSAYAVDAGPDGEIPEGCDQNAIQQSFAVTVKVTELGQAVEVLEATITNPSSIEDDQEQHCAFETTNVFVEWDDGTTTNSAVCTGVFLLPGDSVECTDFGTWVSNDSNGPSPFIAQMTTERDVFVPNGPLPDSSTTSDNTVLRPQSVTLTKEAPEKVQEGDEVVYSYLATNTSATGTLTGCTIDDDQLGLIAGPFDLAAGASLPVDSDPTQINGDITNVATLLCFDQLQEEVQATADATVIVFDPSVSLTKDAPEKVQAGSEVTYSYHAENTGVGDLTDCTIEDDQLGPIAGPFDLAQGESFDAEATTVLNADTTNVATLVCLDQLEGEARAEAEATVIVFNPSILVEKVCSPDTQPAPGTIDWTITVTNDGDSTLYGVTLEDLDLGLNQNIGDMASGEVVVIVHSETDLPGGIYTNTATAVGLDQLENEYESSDTATCEVVEEDFEGHTPGFYKNNWDSWGGESWVVEEGGDSFNDVFGTSVVLNANGKKTYDDPTLREALDANGGGINALARHCVAAKLNAEHPEISYPISTASVIEQCGDAINNGTPEEINSLKTQLDEWNNLGSDVDQHWPY